MISWVSDVPSKEDGLISVMASKVRGRLQFTSLEAEAICHGVCSGRSHGIAGNVGEHTSNGQKR